MEKRKIILDCDPGHDDAIAIMMAAKHPAIDLLGITIVAGNQTLDKTLINGLNVCQKLEINVPVYAGMPQPIMRQQIVADNIHGETGLDGPVFEPLTRQAESTHAVKYIIDTLMASDGDITLVPVGPLSNIAVAMRMQPAILPKIREIVLMGGAYGTGRRLRYRQLHAICRVQHLCRPGSRTRSVHLRRSISDDGPRSHQPDRLHPGRDCSDGKGRRPRRRAVQRHHELHSQNAVRKLRPCWRPGARRHLHRLSD